MSKEFAAMEEAAMKAYQEDLKRLEREASGRLPLFRWTPLFFKRGANLAFVNNRVSFARPGYRTATTSGETSGEAPGQTSGETQGQETAAQSETEPEVQTAAGRGGMGRGTERRRTRILLQHGHRR